MANCIPGTGSHGSMHTPDFAALLQGAEAALPRLLQRTRTLVEMESPSQDKPAVDAVTKVVATWCRDAGAEVTLHPHEKFGDSLEASVRFPGVAETRPTLLLGHLDTVWDHRTLRTMPWREEGDRIHGPGVLDMKAGVAMALTALELLRETGLPAVPVILLLHADEEVGSPASRALTERIAARCEKVFVLEPGQGEGGAYKTARKGVGLYRMEVEGVAAHAGVDFARGHSAVLELGKQLERVAALSDTRRGLTVNPGVIGGGTRSNVVAADAWAEIDVRVSTTEDAVLVEQELKALRPFNPQCTVTVTGSLNRPPMVRTAAISALFGRAASMAKAMGLEPLEEASTGGGSDGNFTAGIGVPTLDGMGAVGSGAHADHEHLLKRYLAPRTALLAAMLLAHDVNGSEG